MPLVQCIHDDPLPVPGRRACSLSIGPPERFSERIGEGVDALLFCGVVEGTVGVTVEHQSPLTLRPSTSIVVRAGTTLSLSSSTSASAVLVLAIGLDVGSFLARRLSPNRETVNTDSIDVAHAYVENSPLLEASLRMLLSLSIHDHPHRHALLDLNATQLLLHLLQTPARPLLLRSHRSLASGLAAAIRHVHRYLHVPLSVDELAEQACMSRSTFYRHFREAFGVTPLQYVTRMRIEHAQTLLRDPARTVTDVSLDLGFNSVSHFIDLFRRQVGTTPRAYQQSLSGERTAE